VARDATEAEVIAYLRERHAAHYELAVWIRRAVLAADPDLTERIFPGWNGVGFRHPEAGYLCAIYPRSEWVVLHFEHGAALPDPDGILLGDGSTTRFVRIQEPSATTGQQITAYVQQAIAERLLR
jgi:hypothetical protein